MSRRIPASGSNAVRPLVLLYLHTEDMAKRPQPASSPGKVPMCRRLIKTLTDLPAIIRNYNRFYSPRRWTRILTWVFFLITAVSYFLYRSLAWVSVAFVLELGYHYMMSRHLGLAPFFILTSPPLSCLLVLFLLWV